MKVKAKSQDYPTGGLPASVVSDFSEGCKCIDFVLDYTINKNVHFRLIESSSVAQH